ncbi:MAG: GNAT family N-acetyltransferase [Clostridia bacterium]|nr:GNAT family N-acetyltransferase [Clostridia bacterium]
MKTARLYIRPFAEEDRESFIRGISNRDLCRMYGLPEKTDETVGGQIFSQFARLETAYSLIRISDGSMVGFVLSVQSELPDEILSELPARGRTFAYATFSPFQRSGYMHEALQALIREAFHDRKAEYIHCGRFEYNAPSEALLRRLGFKEFQRHSRNGKSIVDEVLTAD